MEHKTRHIIHPLSSRLTLYTLFFLSINFKIHLTKFKFNKCGGKILPKKPLGVEKGVRNLDLLPYLYKCGVCVKGLGFSREENDSYRFFRKKS